MNPTCWNLKVYWLLITNTGIYDTQPMTEKVNESVLVVFFWQLSVSPDRDKIYSNMLKG